MDVKIAGATNAVATSAIKKRKDVRSLAHAHSLVLDLVLDPHQRNNNFTPVYKLFGIDGDLTGGKITDNLAI